MVDDRSGWYHGAVPGLYNWDLAEDWDDVNQNGIWDQGEVWTDSDSDGNWDGPQLVQEAINRDGSYWLTPEMYESYENFIDALHILLQWENVPGIAQPPIYTGASDDPYYYMPNYFGDYWGYTDHSIDRFFLALHLDCRSKEFHLRQQNQLLFDIALHLFFLGC